MEYKRVTERSGIYNTPCLIVDFNDEIDASIIAIDALAELEDKIENGTLVELPCKVGEKLFAVVTSRRKLGKHKWSELETSIMPCEVTRFILDKSVFIKTTICCFSICEIGDRLFFTKEEAEARLAELRGKA